MTIYQTTLIKGFPEYQYYFVSGYKEREFIIGRFKDALLYFKGNKLWET